MTKKDSNTQTYNKQDLRYVDVRMLSSKFYNQISVEKAKTYLKLLPHMPKEKQTVPFIAKALGVSRQTVYNWHEIIGKEIQTRKEANNT